MHKLIVGKNDFKTLYSAIASEWDYELNGDAKPENYLPGSDKSFHWLCPNGHPSYPAKIRRRTLNGQGCPICGRVRATKKSNETKIKKRGSLKDKFPEIAEEWDYEQNEGTPEEYGPYSNKIIMWKCKWCGNTWPAEILSRTYQKAGCRKCHFRSQTSFPEQACLFYLKPFFEDIINHYTEIFSNSMELDIYISSKKIGIEYDGMTWHKGKISLEKEKRKYDICKQNGISLIRIRECDYNDGGEYCDKLIIRDNPWNSEALDKAICELFDYLGIEHSDIDSDRDRMDIYAQYYQSARENSLAVKHPGIAKEWNYEKNGDITPEMVADGTTDKYWWICPNGHETYRLAVAYRTGNKHQGCKICSGLKKSQRMHIQKLEIGVNDVKSQKPELLEYWCYDLNEKNPEDYTVGNKEKVYWKCVECRKPYEQGIRVRCESKGLCKECADKAKKNTRRIREIEKQGTLRKMRPDLAEIWDYSSNGNFTPDNIAINDQSQKFQWVCPICKKTFRTEVRALSLSKHVACQSCTTKISAKQRWENIRIKHEPGTPYINSVAKKVAKLDKVTGKIIQVYDSITLACIDNGIPVSSHSNLTLACKNPNRTCKGFKWKFIE